MKITIRKELIDLYNGAESLSLLHLSDLHVRYSTKTLERIGNVITEIKPDLIILTGDYFDVPKGANHFYNFIYKIATIYTVVFIKGNHDALYGKKLLSRLECVPNCHYVEDKVFVYQSIKGYNYHITSWKNRMQLLNTPKTKNIVLIHNPEKIKENELRYTDVLLAGHLHGGQFIFYRTKKGNYFPGNILYNYCTDRRQIKTTTLIVSKGLGDTLPFRFNCPKEIVNIKIV